MVSDVTNALGGMWEGGECIPPPPPGEKKICPSFGYEAGPGGRRLLRLETEVGPRGRRLFMADELERAAVRRAATASCLQLHALPLRHPPIHHSSFAGGRPGLGRAITCHSAGARLAKHPQRPASGSIPAQADAGRGLLHARALLPAQGLEKVRRASCHCNLLPWLHPCLARLTPFSHAVLCSSLFRAFFRCLAVATRSSEAQGRWKGRKIESGL